MKLTVKRKVANGLVVGFLMPPASAVVSDALELDLEGLNAFAAERDFDISTLQDGSPVAMVAVEDPCDPTGVDPSGIVTTCVAPVDDSPTICVRAPEGGLVTAEDGTSDMFEFYAGPPDPDLFDPSGIYMFLSNSEAEVLTETVVISGYSACIPRPIWVSGVDDGYVDGDRGYSVRIKNINTGYLVTSVWGVNLDNDSIPGAQVYVYGPPSLPEGGSGIFNVSISKVDEEETISGHDLLVEPSSGLKINSFAVSGGAFKGKPKLTRTGSLLLKGVSLQFDETMVVTMDIMLTVGGPSDQTVVARFINGKTSEETNNTRKVKTSLP